MPLATTASAPRRTHSPGRLGAYSRSFRQCRRLGRAEEIDLVGRAREGDPAAIAALVEGHFPLAVRTAKAYEGLGLPLEDLVGEACVGLLEAIDRFDPTRGFRFMTYAIWRVRRALSHAVARDARVVRVPRRLARDLGARAWARELSLSDVIDADHDLRLGDLLSEPARAEGEVQSGEIRGGVRRAIGTLPFRQGHVVVRRFGIDGAESASLRSLAGDLGVTKERVRQIEGQGLAGLRAALTPYQG